MEDVVKPVTVGLSDIVRQAIAEIQSVTAQNDGPCVTPPDLAKFDFEFAWELFLLRYVLVE